MLLARRTLLRRRRRGGPWGGGPLLVRPGCLHAPPGLADRRRCSSSGSGSGSSSDADGAGTVLVTTPIFYVNGRPNIGHAYSGLLCDALARWLRLKGRRVLFTTGTDEHGAKVEQASAAAGSASCQAFCDDVSGEFRALFAALNTSHDDFVRTTEPRHAATVAALWRRLRRGAALRRGSFAGWYCQSDEAFLTDAQVEDGKSLESGHAVEWLQEDNYLFSLPQFQQRLAAWLHGEAGGFGSVHPPQRRNEMTAWLSRNELRDLSVSRPRQRVRWALPVPDDAAQSVYVWVDALSNYLTVTGIEVPEDPAVPLRWEDAGVSEVYHVVGKDILRFHALYWPALLMAAGLAPPTHVIAHGHWTVQQTKMSKSLGNVVDPLELLRRFETDAVRYGLLRNGSLQDDLDFSEEALVAKRTDELANTFGNLLSRCLGRKLSPDEHWPGAAADADPQASQLAATHLLGLAEKVDKSFSRLEFPRGLQLVMSALYDANRVFTEQQPWVLRKRLGEPDLGPDERQRLQREFDTSLMWLLETLRVCSILLQPIVPESAGKALDALGIPHDARDFAHAAKVPVSAEPCAYTFERPPRGSVVLFPRIDDDK